MLVTMLATLLMLIFLITSSNFSTQGFASNYAYYEGGVDPRPTRRFKNLIVHIDLKGAPPRVDYLLKFLRLLSKNHVDGVLLEYEDMFPYSEDLEVIRRTSGAHYSEQDIERITREASFLNLEVIPLIQTFGHLEFLLKKPKFMELSEDHVDLNTICISDQKSIQTIESMIRQIRRLHPNSTRIHIGADEAYHVAEDVRCHRKMAAEKIEKSELKLKHIARIGKFARDTGFREVFAWNDMFDKEPENVIKGAELPKWITPVVWGYRVDVTEEGYFPPGLFDRIDNTFERFYVASAYKGADGARQPFSNITRYLENQKSYSKLMDLIHPSAARKVSGIFVTGWSRFNHFNALCELLPVSIPSLIVDLAYLNYGLQGSAAWSAMKTELRCEQEKYLRGVLSEWAIHGCTFPGSEVFELIQHDWKRLVEHRIFGRRDPESTSVDQKSSIEILSSLKEALKPILFDEDIDEIFNQYLTDFHAIHHSTSSTVTPGI